jgi:hypothetical protein
VQLSIQLGAEDRERLKAPEVMEYDPRKPRLSEVRELKRQRGMAMKDLYDALLAEDDEAAALVVWLAMLRHGVVTAWEGLELELADVVIKQVADPNPEAPTSGASTS